jgi:hypothetical protein
MTDVLNYWFENFAGSFNCIKIGKINAVNKTNQTVDVQILHKRINESNLIKRELRDYPLLKSVPFIILGGGNSYLTFPISVGDNCLLLFNDYEIDRWWDTGESLPANFERKHDISDAFALVGVHSMVDLIQGYSNYVHLKYSDSSSITVGEVIDITNTQTNVSGKLTVADDITGNAKLGIKDEATFDDDVTVKGDITGEKKATAELHDTRLASGTFATADQKTVTVQDGIIISIS